MFHALWHVPPTTCPVTTNRFLCINITDGNVKRFDYSRYPLTANSFFCTILFVVSVTKWKKFKADIIIVTACKRGLGQGNIFTSVCQSFCRGWGVSLHEMGRGCIPACNGGVCLGSGRYNPPPPADTPQTATEAGGTHPTGIHSCLMLVLEIFRTFN